MEVHAWQVYVTLGLLFLAAEIVVPGFVMAPIGVAAMATAILSPFVSSLIFQLIMLSVFSVVSYLVLAPLAKSRLARGRDQAVLGLENQTGTVVETWGGPGHPLRVKLYADVWEVSLDGVDSSSETKIKSLQMGASVRVKSVVGNRLIITPIDS